MTTCSRKRILIASSLNAGAEAVAPLVERLMGRGDTVRVLSHRAATATFKSMDIEPDRILENLYAADLVRELTEFEPAIIVTGTQIQRRECPIPLEHSLWWMGSRINNGNGFLPRSIAVMNTWGTELEQFSTLDIRGEVPLRIMEKMAWAPDQIAVLDEYQMQKMLALGFDRKKLVITGNPYFEHVETQIAGLSPNTRAELLAKPVFSGFHKNGTLLVFISDDMSPFPDITFTEKDVLQSFLKTVDRLAEETGMKINLIVRPHPFRNANAQDAFDCETPHIRKVLHNPVSAKGGKPKNNYSMEQLLTSVDLVVGTLNNPLITAKIIGRPVIHYLPGVGTDYEFQKFLSDQGMSTRVTRESDLGTAIQCILDGRIVQKPLEAGKDAIENVIRLIDQLSRT